MTDDAELLRRYVEERSESAFTELVQRHMNLVYGVALRQLNGDAHLAKDAAQMTFTALARKAPSVRRHPTLTGWLYVSSHNAAAAIVRSERRRKSREANAKIMATPENTDALTAVADLEPAIERLLLRLKPADRDAVLLRFFERRNFAEIGSILRTSEEGARKRVERALERLRALLARDGITSSGAALGAIIAGFGAIPAPSQFAAEIAPAALAGSATTPTVLVSVARWLPFAGGFAAALVFVASQSSQRQALQAELAELHAARAEMPVLGAENQRLSRALQEAGDAMAAATSANQAPMPPVRAAPSRSTLDNIELTRDGRLKWNGTFLTLRDFIGQLTTAAHDPTRSQVPIVVRAPGASLYALAYVIDEARKAQVKLIVHSDATPHSSPALPEWF